MLNRYAAVAIGTALVVAACGTGQQAASTTTVLVASTTQPAPTTSTTSASPTTTRTSAPVTVATLDGTVNASPRIAGTFGAAVLTQSPDLEATSGRFEAIITMIPGPASELEADVVITIAGAFAANGDSEFLLDWGNLLSLGLDSQDGAEMPPEFAEIFSEPMQMKVVNGRSYIKWSFFAMFLGTDKWIEGDADESESMTSGFGFGTDGDSPTQLLETLADANADVEELGQEDVRGVSTTHYRAILDIESLAGEMTDDEREELEADLGELNIADFPIDVWIGEDGNVYRYSIEVDASAAGADAEEFGGMTMVFEMWDYGVDVVIEPPPADEIATEDEIGFSFDA